MVKRPAHFRYPYTAIVCCLLSSRRRRFSEWTERKARGWEGDAPLVAGLSTLDEAERLLAQVSHIVLRGDAFR